MSEVVDGEMGEPSLEERREILRRKFAVLLDAVVSAPLELNQFSLHDEQRLEHLELAVAGLLRAQERGDARKYWPTPSASLLIDNDPTRMGFDSALGLLGDWHLAVFGCTATVGELLLFPETGLTRAPKDVAAALRIVLGAELRGNASHGSVRDVQEHLGEVQWLVFRHRYLDAVLGERPTAEALAQELGFTRQQILQTESSALEALNAYLSNPMFAALRWRAARLRHELGAGVPIDSIPARKAVGEGRHEDLFTLWLAGRYNKSGAWLRRERVDPAALLREALGGIESDAIDPSALIAAAVKVEVPAAVALESFESLGLVRNFGGTCFLWSGSVADKAEIILSVLGVSSPASAILDNIGPGVKLGNLKNQMAADSRFVRAGKKMWALSSWGVSAYEGITEELIKGIERAGGIADRSTLFAEVIARGQVARTSVEAFANTPRFVTEGSSIRLRREDEAVPLPVRPSYSNVFGPAAGVIRWRTVVDGDWLRGSGRSVPMGLALELGATAGSGAVYLCSQQTIEVGWRMTDLGPHVTSLRQIIENAGAEAGEEIVLCFDTRTRLAQIQVVPVEAAGTLRLEIITGIRGEQPLAEIALALGIEEAEVKSALNRRDFGDLVDLLDEELVDNVESLRGLVKTKGDTLTGVSPAWASDGQDAAALVDELADGLRKF